ncbi:hypothetical protein FOCC_FOCC007477 [Frankliniella occidentalis]|nr:hypothetical protein FOCC_FOCC007477 [Frankliniella occidentalis]
MKKMRPAFGYQKSLFDVLSTKTAKWREMERHIILLDEIKLQAGTEFDRNLLLQWGFVDMGKFTPEDHKNELGDHALVVLFQPFAGGWVQSLGCFLSKGNVKGDVLAKIALEGVNLSARARLRVDGIVTDKGAWNRVMWREFGIGDKNENDVSACTNHPCDDNRKMWFFSDWCHLIKCMRNKMCPENPKSREKKQLTKISMYKSHHHVPLSTPETPKTPDGEVKRIHWVAVWNEEEKCLRKQQLRFVPSLNQSVLFPNGFERMNVRMAFVFFSNNMQAGMEYYKEQGIPELSDCEPTLRLLEKAKKLAKAMNSGYGLEGFRRDSTAEEAN